MRFFLSLVILFAVAIGIAVGAHFNHGNVVFFYAPYRIDLSLNLFILIAVLSFFVLYVLINALREAQRMPQRVAAYRKDKREREGNRAMRDSLRALFEGRFGHAEKAAARALENPENEGLSALIGARAAHRLGQPERRNEWLDKVKDDVALKSARLMTTIELLNDERDPQAALDAVNELSSSGTRHIHALRLALQANQRAENWPEVLRLLRLLDKRNAVHPALSRKLRELAYADLLDGHGHDEESIRRVWAEVPAADRVQPFVAALAANAFNERGLHDEARNVIEKALAVEWDERLVRAYGASAAPEGSPTLLAQIEHCEQWMIKHPGDAELALTLGSLCLRQKLWGKAQKHLEQALSDASEAGTVRQAHLKLAQLHEALNQPEQAASHYRQCALATML
jgi:HemY protein